MKQRLLPVLLLFALALAACGGSPESKYEQHGIAFTKPAGWKISDEEYTEEANTLFIEKEGFTSSGLLLVQWYPGLLDPAMMVEVYVESLNSAEETSGLERTQPQPTELNGVAARVIHYSFRTLGVPYSGKCTCFQCGDQTVLIAEQGADEDKETNEDGFRIVEKSLRCR